jgi:hypothetical protein
MTDKKRLAWRLFLTVLLLWGVGKVFNLYQIHFPNRNHPMTPLLQDMQTFCVGNYLVDLPRGSVPVYLETDLSGYRQAKVRAYPDRSHSEFQRKVIDRWEAIKDWKKEDLVIFDQPSQRFDIIPDGVVMTSQHHTPDPKDLLYPDGPKSFYETEGYLWREGTLYVFSDSATKERLIEAMQTLQPRKDDEIPATEGFCGGRSFFPGKPDPMDFVEFAFRLPIETSTEFRIRLPAGQSPRPDLSRWESSDIKIKTLRKASRTQAGLEGSELMMYDWQKEDEASYKTSLSAEWFGHDKNLPVPAPVMGGTVYPDNGFPGITMRLNANSEAEGVAPPKVGEMVAPKDKAPMTIEEFSALWDGIVASLRLRPTVSAQ